MFEAEDRIVSFQPHENGGQLCTRLYIAQHHTVVTALSGPGGATLRSFDALTGDLILEKRLHHPHAGILSEPSDLRVDMAFKDVSHSAYPDLFVLTNGNTLHHLAGRNGEVKWTWLSPDQRYVILVYINVAKQPQARLFCTQKLSRLPPRYI